jgi:glycosyltransferase involved in cell wall biosynthesis
MKKNKISLIISTHNRPRNILKIINCLQKQVNFSKIYQIIICGSSSEDTLKIGSYIKNFLNLDILYLNSRVNHQAHKRNFAAQNASGEYLIFIDDDCFPDNKFYFNHYSLLKINKKKTIYCGAVEYVKNIKNNNLIKYRNDRLISHNSLNSTNVPVKNFISMNMCISKNILQNSKYLFDNRFRFYGFEDFEFAYRFRNKGYKIILSKALVMHKDFRSFNDYLNKFTALVDGLDDIKRINLDAAKKSIFYKIKENTFIKLILKIPFIYQLLDNSIKIIIFMEKRFFFYCPVLYKIGIFLAFLKGLKVKFSLQRQYNYLLKSNNWYK